MDPHGRSLRLGGSQSSVAWSSTLSGAATAAAAKAASFGAPLGEEGPAGRGAVGREAAPRRLELDNNNSNTTTGRGGVRPTLLSYARVGVD